MATSPTFKLPPPSIDNLYFCAPLHLKRFSFLVSLMSIYDGFLPSNWIVDVFLAVARDAHLNGGRKELDLGKSIRPMPQCHEQRNVLMHTFLHILHSRELRKHSQRNGQPMWGAMIGGKIFSITYRACFCSSLSSSSFFSQRCCFNYEFLQRSHQDKNKFWKALKILFGFSKRKKKMSVLRNGVWLLSV